MCYATMFETTVCAKFLIQQVQMADKEIQYINDLKVLEKWFWSLFVTKNLWVTIVLTRLCTIKLAHNLSILSANENRHL